MNKLIYECKVDGVSISRSMDILWYIQNNKNNTHLSAKCNHKHLPGEEPRSDFCIMQELTVFLHSSWTSSTVFVFCIHDSTIPFFTSTSVKDWYCKKETSGVFSLLSRRRGHFPSAMAASTAAWKFFKSQSIMLVCEAALSSAPAAASAGVYVAWI